jgi:hypothetical protein
LTGTSKDYVAGRQADTQAQVDLALSTQPTGEAVEGLVQRQCRDAGLHCVVLVGQRRAEDSHDPVAADTVDGAATALDDVGEHWNDAGLQLIRQIWFEAEDRLRQAGHVRDEDRDALLLAAAFRRFALIARGLPLYGAGSACLGPRCWAKPRGRSGRAIELNTTLGGERQRFGEPTRRLPLRAANGALKILNGAQADPGSLREGSLGQPGVQSVLSDQIAE